MYPSEGYNSTLAQGLEQLARYADRLQTHTRTLVIFDRRPEIVVKPWDERMSLEVVQGVLDLRG